MLLANVYTADSDTPRDIIVDTHNPALNLRLEFKDALAFKGLVNWHDHLDFNLFTQLGGRTYDNYTQWGAYIHRHYSHEIASVLKVPLELRTRWGLYKNMLGGVSQVVNHGERLHIDKPPIRVEQGHSIHSVRFEKWWKLKLNNPLKAGQPVMVHVGEGVNDDAHKEIDELIKWNLLGRKLTGIHGVAMTPQQAERFDNLVWCPASNYFLLGKTAPVQQLKPHTRIRFGTDSTLTAPWDIWTHIRLARETQMLSDKELYDMVAADDRSVVVAKKNEGLNAMDAFYAITPADLLLMICRDKVCLFDDTLATTLRHLDASLYSRVTVGASTKYVMGDLPALINKIKSYYPGAGFPVNVS